MKIIDPDEDKIDQEDEVQMVHLKEEMSHWVTQMKVEPPRNPKHMYFDEHDDKVVILPQ